MEASTALAGGTLILTTYGLLLAAGPSAAELRMADKDSDTRAKLRTGELATAGVVTTAALAVCAMTGEAWPLLLGLVALAASFAVHEHALATPPPAADAALAVLQEGATR